MVDGNRRKPRDGQAGVTQSLARSEFGPGDRGRLRRVARESERPRDMRGNHRRSIADDEQAPDGVIRLLARGGKNRVNRRALLVKADRDGAILPRVLEHVAAIRREDELHPESLGGLAERTRLVSRRRREQEYAFHIPQSAIRNFMITPEPPAPDSVRLNSTRAR